MMTKALKYIDDKSATIKKPEVGDVWENDSGIKIVFICVNSYYWEYIEHCTILTESFDIYRVNSGCYDWKNGRRYLGKSKANISELFEVQDE